MKNNRLSVLSLAVLLIVVGPAFSADPPPDPDKVAIWQKVKLSLFGDRTVVPDNGQVISLKAAVRAEDASTVPISIKTHVDQTAAKYIQKVYLLIDRNPSPIAAVFSFTPQSGRADIDTRVRIEQYTHMRAIAEMNDGKLYMATHYIKASGGCSAPSGTLPDLSNFKGKAKIKVDRALKPDQPTLAQLMIQHPNASGLAKDQLTHLYQPAYYVRTINVTYGGKPILSADVDFSISENPNFRFYFLPGDGGELKAEAVDTKDLKIESLVKVIPQPS